MDNENTENDDIFAELGLPSLNQPEKAAPATQSAPPVSRSAPVPDEDLFAPEPEAEPEIEEEVAPQPQAPSASSRLKKHSQNVPLSLAAVLAKKSIALKEVANLKSGDVVTFSKNPQDLVDLVANGKLIARGELVLVDGKVAIQIRQLVG